MNVHEHPPHVSQPEGIKPLERRHSMEESTIDFAAELKLFTYVRQSASTRSAYNGAVRIIHEWLMKRSFTITDMTPELAVEFIRDLKEEGCRDPWGRGHRLSEQRVQAIVRICGTFFSHLQRHYDGVQNPFLGASHVPNPISLVAVSAPEPPQARAF